MKDTVVVIFELSLHIVCHLYDNSMIKIFLNCLGEKKWRNSENFMKFILAEHLYVVFLRTPVKIFIPTLVQCCPAGETEIAVIRLFAAPFSSLECIDLQK